MPKVSILIPTYNGAAHIAAAIESALADEGVSKEVIVVDDASRDDTVAIARTYESRGVRVERNPVNLGPEGNWNRALGLATGDYVKLLPQDDLVAPGGLAAQAAVLDDDRGQGIALVFGARTIVDARGRTVMKRGLGRRAGGRVAAAWLVRACVIGGTNQVGEPGGVMFRRALSDRVGPFDGQPFYTIDVDYWLRLLAHGDAWYLADVVSSFRINGGSYSVRNAAIQARDYATFLDKVRARGLIADRGLDVMVGKVMARALTVARRLVYRFLVA